MFVARLFVLRSCAVGRILLVVLFVVWFILAHALRLAIQSMVHRKETAHTKGYGTNPTLAARGNFRPGLEPNA